MNCLPVMRCLSFGLDFYTGYGTEHRSQNTKVTQTLDFPSDFGNLSSTQQQQKRGTLQTWYFKGTAMHDRCPFYVVEVKYKIESIQLNLKFIPVFSPWWISNVHFVLLEELPIELPALPQRRTQQRD